MVIDINPNTQVCIKCKIRRHNFLFDRTDKVCNWCNMEEEHQITKSLNKQIKKK